MGVCSQPVYVFKEFNMTQQAQWEKVSQPSRR